MKRALHIVGRIFGLGGKVLYDKNVGRSWAKLTGRSRYRPHIGRRDVERVSRQIANGQLTGIGIERDLPRAAWQPSQWRPTLERGAH